MKPRRPIDPQGHRERPGKVPAVVVCEACQEMRIKSEQWRAPCSRRDKAWPPKYMGEDEGQ